LLLPRREGGEGDSVGSEKGTKPKREKDAIKEEFHPGVTWESQETPSDQLKAEQVLLQSWGAYSPPRSHFVCGQMSRSEPKRL